MAQSNTSHDNLNQILKEIQKSDIVLSPNDISTLVAAFANDSSSRPSAYVVLSVFCQKVRTEKEAKDPAKATQLIATTFSKEISDVLSETNDTSLLRGVTFLTALFQVDAQAASSLFLQEGLVENLMDTIELSPSGVLSQELAHLLGQACGLKSCRGAITPQIVRWLEFKSRQPTDPILQGAASVALIKLARGAVSDGPENGTPAVTISDSTEMATMMMNIVLSSQETSQSDAIEGLAYLSTDPSVKETLSENNPFLKRLFSLVPRSKAKPSVPSNDSIRILLYGILVIICNLASYRPVLTEEQQQMEKLKRMAKSGSGSTQVADEPSPLDDNEHVGSRIQKLIDAGVLPVFWPAISLSDTAGVKEVVSKSVLSIVEDKSNRGKVLQAGGTKVLQTIIKQSLPTSVAGKDATANVGPSTLDAVQALAKLSITSSPLQVYGPNVGAMYDAIRPFSILLQHPSSNLLQRFEAVMALTNLASVNEDMATRIADSEGLINKVELLMLEEHMLVRRAATELICNLVAGSEKVFQRYSGQGNQSSTSKIHILLALSDADDLPTRLAASGALAVLTAASSACQALVELQMERHRFLPIMAQLVDPSTATTSAENEDDPLGTDPGLVHRAVVCLANVFKSVNDKETRKPLLEETKKCGLYEGLSRLEKGQGLVKERAVEYQAAEALKAINRK